MLTWQSLVEQTDRFEALSLSDSQAVDSRLADFAVSSATAAWDQVSLCLHGELAAALPSSRLAGPHC